jgi:hypothetical protein
MFSKTSFPALARTLVFAGVAGSLITACSGGSTSQPTVLPQTGGQLGNVPATEVQSGTHRTTLSTTATAPSVVQSHGGGGACTSSKNVTLGSQPKAGDLILIYAQLNSTSATLTAPTGFSTKDSKTGSWFHEAEFYKVATGAEGTTYGIVSNCSGGALTWVVADITGENQSTPFDQHNTTITTSTGIKTFTTASLTPSQANDLAISMITPGSNGLTVSSIAPSAWTVGPFGAQYTENLHWGAQTATTAVKFSETTSSSTSWASSETLDLINPASAMSATPTPSPTATPVAATPSPAPTATPAQGGNSPYTFNGIPVYTANDWFTTNLVTGGSAYATNTVDPNSSAIINNYNAAMGNPKFNINGSNTTVGQNAAVNLATNSTPTYAVQGCIYGCRNWDGTTSVRVPWQNGFLEQGGCTVGDCHDLVLNTSSHIAYDTFNSGKLSWNGSSFSAEAAYSHNLSQSYDSQRIGGPDNAGIAYWGTVLMGEDAALPSINHIIEVSIAGTDGGPIGSGGWVAPATAGNACASSCTNKLPMGARLRLKASHTCPSASTNPQANKICTTMKTYGIIVIDHNGSGSGGTFGPQLERRMDGSNPWNQTDVQALNGISLTEFDVMTLGTIH